MHMYGPDRLRGPFSRMRPFWFKGSVNSYPNADRLRSLLWGAPVMVSPRDDCPREEAIRVDLVARVRREIRQGTYETPEKLEVAFARLVKELEEDAS